MIISNYIIKKEDLTWVNKALISGLEHSIYYLHQQWKKRVREKGMERGGRIRGEAVEKRERKQEGKWEGWDRNGEGKGGKKKKWERIGKEREGNGRG